MIILEEKAKEYIHPEIFDFITNDFSLLELKKQASFDVRECIITRNNFLIFIRNSLKPHGKVHGYLYLEVYKATNKVPDKELTYLDLQTYCVQNTFNEYPGNITFYLKNDLYVIQDVTYYRNGKRHRVDGPALILFGVQTTKTWFVNGIFVDEGFYPIFEDGEQVNNLVITNSIMFDLLNFDREYFEYVNRNRKCIEE